MDFTVNLIDPCKTEAISVDSAVLTNLVIAYHIYNPPDLQALSFDSIDRSVQTITCPQITVVVETQDVFGSLDPDVMTYDPIS